jgi:N-carbamoylputrescine amidase
MSREIKVAAIQQCCSGEHDVVQHATAEAIATAAAAGADLVVLPELHAGPYFPQREDEAFFAWAETIPGLSTDFFGAVAQREGVVLVASFFEKSETDYFNTAVVFERDGSIAGTYRKSHIPEDPGFHEKYYFCDGDGEIAPIATSVGVLGVLVCWDQWFPEAARTMAARGAEILIYPTAIGTIPDDDEGNQFCEAWVTIQRAHSIANALPVVSVNRVGCECDALSSVGSITFWGSSFITSTMGEMLAHAGSEPEILYADIMLERTAETRRLWPFYRDLRPDLYELPRSACD